MLERILVEEGSSWANRYLEARQRAYPNLVLGRDAPGVRHIALLNQDHFVGGVSLGESRLLAEDEDLKRNWAPTTSLSGARISRLWIDRSSSRHTLSELFNFLRTNLGQEGFLYGILSLPLGYTTANPALLNGHLGYLKPLRPIDQCEWQPEAEPTSEGKCLFRTYLKLGALLLGPASGSPEDRSVRVAMGMNGQEAVGAWDELRRDTR